MSNPNATQSQVKNAGERAVLILYHSNEPTIDLTREKMLSSKVLKAKSFVKPETLPPTSSAVKFHSYRSHYQIMTWLSLESNIDATDWGWMNIDNKYIPKTTDHLPAPESLLKVIHCNCTLDCSTLRCVCRKNGLQFSSLCGQCQVKECANSSMSNDLLEVEDTDSENEDEL